MRGSKFVEDSFLPVTFPRFDNRPQDDTLIGLMIISIYKDFDSLVEIAEKYHKDYRKKFAWLLYNKVTKRLQFTTTKD